MLITLKELLSKTEYKNRAFGSFNAPNYESALAIIEAGEQLNLPVILSPGPGHDCYIQLEQIMGIYRNLAKYASIDVCIHVDHVRDLNYIKRALDLGATSVMFDGSHESFNENLRLTKLVVEMAKEYGASVEAELGQVANSTFGHSETDFDDNQAIYTDVFEAKIFVRETKIDALAIAVGTVHGIYIQKPILNLPLINEIRKVVDAPLVLHGGSGVSDQDILTAIKYGVRKINYYTYMSLAGGMACKKVIEKQDKVFFHDIALIAKDAMKEDALRAMSLFTFGKISD